MFSTIVEKSHGTYAATIIRDKNTKSCAALDNTMSGILNSRTCWSLLYLVDANKLAKAVHTSENVRSSIRNIVEQIKIHLHRIRSIGSECGVETNLYIPDDATQMRDSNIPANTENVATNERSDDANGSDGNIESNEPSAHDIIEDDDFMNSSNEKRIANKIDAMSSVLFAEKPTDLLMKEIKRMDGELKALVACVTMCLLPQNTQYVRNARFASGNGSVNEAHASYLMSTLGLRPQFSSSDCAPKKMQLQGNFLISLEKMNHKNMRYDKLTDRSRALDKTCAAYINANSSVHLPTFLNIGPRRNHIVLRVLGNDDNSV